MLAAAPRTQCTHCGNAMPAAHRVDDAGKGYCQRCYYALFPRVDCTDCGGQARARRDDPHPLCFRCRRAAFWKGKQCVRCGRDMDQIARRYILEGDTVCCNACLHHLRPKTCAYCGFVGTSVHRD